ncbi:hypothetical protein Abr02nite_47400 [Paractinoplanes brasiliensis]|nr:hypothetical protein Abr02nite_47400 [Actinoplanes brasiliensis]
MLGGEPTGSAGRDDRAERGGRRAARPTVAKTEAPAAPTERIRWAPDRTVMRAQPGNRIVLECTHPGDIRRIGIAVAA